VLALLLPIYRPETLLGFVLGVIWVFGPVLPTAIGALLAAVSALVHMTLWPLAKRGWQKIRGEWQVVLIAYLASVSRTAKAAYGVKAYSNPEQNKSQACTVKGTLALVVLAPRTSLTRTLAL
jgi:hypothetical protein